MSKIETRINKKMNKPSSKLKIVDEEIDSDLIKNQVSIDLSNERTRLDELCNKYSRAYVRTSAGIEVMSVEEFFSFLDFGPPVIELILESEDSDIERMRVVFQEKLQLEEISHQMAKIKGVTKKASFAPEVIRQLSEILNEEAISGGSSGLERSRLQFASDYDHLKFYTQKVIPKTSDIYQNFFKVKNNGDLFHTGQAYVSDLQKGLKCFGISADGNKDALVETLFGLVSFFNFYKKFRVVVICSYEEFEQLQEFDFTFSKNEVTDTELGVTYSVHESECMSVIVYDQIEKDVLHVLTEFLVKVIDISKVVLCSLPGQEVIDQNIHLYFQVIHQMSNVSFICVKDKTKVKRIKAAVKKLRMYDKEVKGIIWRGEAA